MTNDGKTDNARKVSHAVPADRAVRDAIASAMRRWIAEQRLTPPLKLDQLERHAAAALAQASIDARYLAFAVVTLHGELWRPVLAAVPHNRRLLLLPQCLRSFADCPARIDELGLVCRHCGRCPIDRLTLKAEQLGCVTLVAEGTAVVASLIASGRVQAVIGASCLVSLEAVFPLIDLAGCPSLALPLLYDGCKDTVVDEDLLTEALEMTVVAPAAQGDDRVNLREISRRVEQWFTAQPLRQTLGCPQGRTEKIASALLAAHGKRYRPLLLAGTFGALRDCGADWPAAVRTAAVAVECFHKASLVHDDIEDADTTRDGKPTLHQRFGLAAAINVGDLLVGEGYRLLGQCDAPGEARARMLTIASEGHRSLCIGQGAELDLSPRRRLPTSQVMTEIYANKTAPAFEVALRLGAVLAGREDVIDRAAGPFCRALGIAYQLRDDREDLLGASGDLQARRPSLLLAEAARRADASQRLMIESLWAGRADANTRDELAPVLHALADELLGNYRTEAQAAMDGIDCRPLRELLGKVMAGIFTGQGARR